MEGPQQASASQSSADDCLKNGPALAGQGPGAVRGALTTALLPLPRYLHRSFTWD